MLHRKILDAALGNLPEDKAAYFANVAQRLEEDPRTQAYPNIVFLVMKETVPLLPINLPERELIELLLAFVERNHRVLNRLIFDPRFLQSPSFLRQVTDELVTKVVDRTLELYRQGEIDSGESSFYRVRFPSGEGDFPYVDDEEDEEGEA